MELSKRISPEIETQINERITYEYKSAYIYFNMANWCNCYGFYKAKDKYRQYGEEELKHAHKLENYINDRNGRVALGVIPSQTSEYKSLLDVLIKSYEHEITITEAYKNLSRAVMAAGDMVTFSELEWFVHEQIEEEAKFGDVIITANRLGITDETKGIEIIELENQLVG